MNKTVVGSKVFRFAETLPEPSLVKFKQEFRKKVSFRGSLVIFFLIASVVFSEVSEFWSDFFKFGMIVFGVLFGSLFHEWFQGKTEVYRINSENIERITERSLDSVSDWVADFGFWTIDNSMKSDYGSYLVNRRNNFTLFVAARNFSEGRSKPNAVECSRLHTDLGDANFEDTDNWVDVSYTVLDNNSFRVDVSEPYFADR